MLLKRSDAINLANTQEDPIQPVVYHPTDYIPQSASFEIVRHKVGGIACNQRVTIKEAIEAGLVEIEFRAEEIARKWIDVFSIAYRLQNQSKAPINREVLFKTAIKTLSRTASRQVFVHRWMFDFVLSASPISLNAVRGYYEQSLAEAMISPDTNISARLAEAYLANE